MAWYEGSFCHIADYVPMPVIHGLYDMFVFMYFHFSIFRIFLIFYSKFVSTSYVMNALQNLWCLFLGPSN